MAQLRNAAGEDRHGVCRLLGPRAPNAVERVPELDGMIPPLRPASACRRYAGARRVLDRLADKWTLLIICSLERGKLRFSELRDEVGGVSQKVLTQTLRAMERDGFVVRTAYAEVPPRVEYELTELGRALIEPADAIARWADDYLDAVDAARRRYDGSGPVEDG